MICGQTVLGVRQYGSHVRFRKFFCSRVSMPPIRPTRLLPVPILAALVWRAEAETHGLVVSAATSSQRDNEHDQHNRCYARRAGSSMVTEHRCSVFGLGWVNNNNWQTRGWGNRERISGV